MILTISFKLKNTNVRAFIKDRKKMKIFFLIDCSSKLHFELEGTIFSTNSLLTEIRLVSKSNIIIFRGGFLFEKLYFTMIFIYQ